MNGCRFSRQVDVQLIDAQEQATGKVFAPDEGADTGVQFGQMNGLRKAVVGSGVKAGDPGFGCIVDRQEDDPAVVIHFLQGAQDADAGEVGGAAIEKDAIITGWVDLAGQVVGIQGQITEISFPPEILKE